MHIRLNISQKITLLLFVVFVLNTINSYAQENTFDKTNITITPIVNFQAWATYTLDYEVYNIDRQNYEAVDNRLNFMMRRMNLGFKGKAFNQFSYVLLGAFDFIGKDLLAGTVGIGNNGGSPIFRLWTAKVGWKAYQDNDLLHLTFGYMTPMLGRSSNNSAFRIGSFEKAWSQNYIRRHTVGTGPGRAVGFNAGGQYKNEENGKFAIDYNLGLFNPSFPSLGGNSAGIAQSPLLTYRVAFHFGEPEFAQYNNGHKHNYFGKRNGLTLAFSGSENGEMASWDVSRSYGVDFLANWGGFNLGGEWMTLYRSSANIGEASSQTGYIRLSYNIPMGARNLEPVVTYVFFNGETTDDGQERARNLGALSGEDRYFELTLNYYFSPSVYLSLAYIDRSGSSGSSGDGFGGNNYFFQGGVGSIKRGDYLGLGFVFLL